MVSVSLARSYCKSVLTDITFDPLPVNFDQLPVKYDQYRHEVDRLPPKANTFTKPGYGYPHQPCSETYQRRLVPLRLELFRVKPEQYSPALGSHWSVLDQQLPVLSDKRQGSISNGSA